VAIQIKSIYGDIAAWWHDYRLDYQVVRWMSVRCRHSSGGYS